MIISVIIEGHRFFSANCYVLPSVNKVVIIIELSICAIQFRTSILQVPMERNFVKYLLYFLDCIGRITIFVAVFFVEIFNSIGYAKTTCDIHR